MIAPSCTCFMQSYFRNLPAHNMLGITPSYLGDSTWIIVGFYEDMYCSFFFTLTRLSRTWSTNVSSSYSYSHFLSLATLLFLMWLCGSSCFVEVERCSIITTLRYHCIIPQYFPFSLITPISSHFTFALWTELPGTNNRFLADADHQCRHTGKVKTRHQSSCLPVDFHRPQRKFLRLLRRRRHLQQPPRWGGHLLQHRHLTRRRRLPHPTMHLQLPRNRKRRRRTTFARLEWYCKIIRRPFMKKSSDRSSSTSRFPGQLRRRVSHRWKYFSRSTQSDVSAQRCGGIVWWMIRMLFLGVCYTWSKTAFMWAHVSELDLLNELTRCSHMTDHWP